MINKIEWNDGMSVGVKAIDNDHKHLILLIDSLSSAIELGEGEDVLEGLINQLADYADDHFKREEALMKSCNYHDVDNHGKLHSEFLEKIPAFKLKLLNADSIRVALEVNSFLYEWLLNHVLVDDMACFDTLIEQGTIKPDWDNNSKLPKLINKISQSVQLRWRLAFSSLIPLTAFLILAGIIASTDHVTYKKLKALDELGYVIYDINEVLQQIQKERGLSAGYISSKYVKFETALLKQRALTNKAITEIYDTLQNHSTYYPNIYGELEIRDLTHVLESIRTQIDSKSTGINSVKEKYTDQIRYLLNYLLKLSNLEISSQLSNRILSLATLFELSESLGQERSIGIQYLEQDLIENNSFSTFEHYQAAQHVLFKIYLQLSHNVHSDAWSHKQDSAAHIRETKVERTLMKRYDALSELSQISSLEWFKIYSERIADVGYLTTNVADELHTLVKDKLQYLEFKFYVTALFLIAMLVLTLLISWLLNRSIILPVRNITTALNTLAEGFYNYRFRSSYGDDELGDMIKNYEHCRLSLLKLDVKSNIRFQRQDINLLSEAFEKERYEKAATVDPLTGALNRRKYTELSAMLIAQCQRYHHPLSMMMLDIDFFKAINDTYGHAKGDVVLQKLVQTCQKTIRDTDILVRFGGEEFLILTPETKPNEAVKLAERIRNDISDLRIPHDEGTISLTVSIGVANWHKDLSASDLEHMADNALYEAKNTGRNRVVQFIA